MVTVAIVTDSDVLAKSWISILAAISYTRFVGVYSSGASLVEDTRHRSVDIVLLGLGPKDHPIHDLFPIQESFAGTRVLVLASDPSDEQLFATLRLGVQGFLVEPLNNTLLNQALQQLQRGETPLSPVITRRILDTFQETPKIDNLSERETEVYSLLCDGKNYREIAEVLYVSGNTVRFHLKNIYKKLGVKSRHEAVVQAFQAGQIERL